MQRNRKKSTNLAQILHPTILPPLNTAITNFTFETLCKNLLKVATKRQMAKALSYKFANHEVLAFDFCQEEMQGEINIGVVHVAQAVENFLARKEKRPLPHPIQLKSSTKLNTFGLVVGYFTTTVLNRTNKKYNRYKTDKRNVKQQFISMDRIGGFAKNGDSSEKRTLHDELVSPGSMELNYEYRQTLGHVIKSLRDMDKKANQALSKTSSLPIPRKSMSLLSRLFVALINPRNQGNALRIQQNLNMTEHMFKRTKEELMDTLRNNFAEDCSYLLYHLRNSKSDNFESVKPKDKDQKIKKKLEVHTVFNMTNEKNKIKYSYTVAINEMINGKWQPYKVVNRHELIVSLKSKKKVTYDQAKNSLKQKAQEDEIRAKQLLQSEF